MGKKILLGLIVLALCIIAFHQGNAATTPVTNPCPLREVCTGSASFNYVFPKDEWILFSIPLKNVCCNERFQIVGDNPSVRPGFFYNYPDPCSTYTLLSPEDAQKGEPVPGIGLWTKSDPIVPLTFTIHGNPITQLIFTASPCLPCDDPAASNCKPCSPLICSHPPTTCTCAYPEYPPYPAWYLIGSLDVEVPILDRMGNFIGNNIICKNGDGNVIACGDLVVPIFFGYDGGYTPTNTLLPGKGHWVKFKQYGSLIINRPTAAAKSTLAETLSPIDATLNQLIISDSMHHSMKLYYGIPAQPIAKDMTELPPATGLKGAFDVRFGSNRFIKTFTSPSGQLPYTIWISATNYPLTLSWDVKQANIYSTTISYPEASLPPTVINVNGTGSITINGPVSNIVLQVSPLPVIKPPSTCFLKGTPILMADGTLEPIEKIRVKDKVMAYDEVSKQLKPDTVKKTFRHQTDQYLIVNGHLKVTPNHPVFSSGKWIEIGKLRVKDTLLNAQGKLEPITSIKLVNQKVRVFHFEVNPYHTFIAGGIVVHNAKAPPSSTVKAVN